VDKSDRLLNSTRATFRGESQEKEKAIRRERERVRAVAEGRVNI